MSISASTCLSNTGTTTLGPTLNIYSNPISPINPGTYVTNVPTDDITGGNCPYTLILPDGTTSIRLSDPTSGCYTDITIEDNDMCVTCNLNFNTFTSPSVGNIVVGDITGSCDTIVTDYLISWYETGDTVNSVFTSGYGTEFEPYDYVHPLTGTSSVLATSGTYDAILEKIKLNGVVFSRSGETGTVLADLDCLPSIINGDPIVITALNCSNGGGSSDLSQYEHRFEYNAGTGGKTPEPLSTTFELSAGTKYFPWKFQGSTVPDSLKLTLIGSEYPDPILLEYWVVGDTPGSNFTPTSYPKSADTVSFFNKITTLTGLTINSGDEILIEVIPSTTNTQTSWIFYCGCLEEVDCYECTPSSAMTTSGEVSYQYKISADTITSVTGSCDTIDISFNIVSSCDYPSFTASTYYKYMGGYLDPRPQIPASFNNLYLTNTSCVTSLTGNTTTFSCLNYGTPTDITYEKSSGLFKITSNNPTVISTHYDRYISNILPYISTSFSGDNTNIEYYRYFSVNYPTSTGSTPCGDGTGNKQILFHQTSIVSTGTTGSDYYIEFTMPTISDGITFSSCDLNCDTNVSIIVNAVNDRSTGTTYNYTGTTNVGSTFNNLVRSMAVLRTINDSNSDGGTSPLSFISPTDNFTYPASGTPYTIIPSLSASTCPELLNSYYFTGSNYRKYLGFYFVELFDPTDYQNFRILSSYINSQGFPDTLDKTIIYEYSGGTGTIIDPDYFI